MIAATIGGPHVGDAPGPLREHVIDLRVGARPRPRPTLGPWRPARKEETHDRGPRIEIPGDDCVPRVGGGVECASKSGEPQWRAVTQMRTVHRGDANCSAFDLQCGGDGDTTHSLAGESSEFDDRDVPQRECRKQPESPAPFGEHLSRAGRSLGPCESSAPVVEAPLAGEVRRPRLPSPTRYRGGRHRHSFRRREVDDMSAQAGGLEADNEIIVGASPEFGADQYGGPQGNGGVERPSGPAPAVDVGVQVGSHDTHGLDLTPFSA